MRYGHAAQGGKTLAPLWHVDMQSDVVEPSIGKFSQQVARRFHAIGHQRWGQPQLSCPAHGSAELVAVRRRLSPW